MTWLGRAVLFSFFLFCVAIVVKAVHAVETSYRDGSIYQARHGFRVGDLVTQTSVSARSWVLASATVRSPATHVVVDVVDVDRFRVSKASKVNIENHKLGPVGSALYLGDDGKLSTTFDIDKLPQRVGAVTSDHTIEVSILAQTVEIQTPDTDFPPYLRNTIIVSPEDSAVNAILRISSVPPSVLPWYLFSSNGKPDTYLCTMKQLLIVPKGAVSISRRGITLEYRADAGTEASLALMNASGEIQETVVSPPSSDFTFGELALPGLESLDVRGTQTVHLIITMKCTTPANNVASPPPEVGVSKLNINWNIFV